MPIRKPGYKPVRSKLHLVQRAKKNIAAVLSLTAMVDLFTVLTVFLLQNYNVTGVALQIPKNVVLPSAKMSEELTPANVITVTKEGISVGERKVASLDSVRGQEKWLIQDLRDVLAQEIQKAREKQENSPLGLTNNSFRKVTVQADRDVEFSVVKRVMYTATEAGAGEVNFAVLKKLNEDK